MGTHLFGSPCTSVQINETASRNHPTAVFRLSRKKRHFRHPILASQNKAVCHEVQMHVLSYPPPKFTKMFWAHFHDFCVQKRSCLLWSPGSFWRFSPCRLKKSSGRIFSIFASKNEDVCVKFRRIFDVFALHALYKMFWAHFHDLCVQKRSYLRWSSDCFWKFSAYKFIKKKLWAQFLDLCVQKRSCFLWSSDAFRKYSACEFYRKTSGRNSTIFASKKRSCLPWNLDAFWKLSTCKFYR